MLLNLYKSYNDFLYLISKLHEEGAKKKFTYLDAPVSGGVTGAAAGTLTFMVGAPNEEVFKVKNM